MKSTKRKKLVIAGGSGFLGRALISQIAAAFEEAIVLTRKFHPDHDNVRYVRWDGQHAGPWMCELEQVDLLINLCGKSVNCRYHQQNKEEILQSRVRSTLALGAAVISANNPPKCWMNASSATIYTDENKIAHTESRGKLGDSFSEGVCKTWEETFNEIPVPTTRKVILRMGLVLGLEGGVLPEMMNLVNVGLGGTAGKGNQRVSWIHEADLAELILDAYEKEWRGVINCTAPTHPTNKEFMSILRETMKQKLNVPVSNWMLETGAWMKGTETELITKSRFVYPERALKKGFQFKFPILNSALTNLIDHEKSML